MFSWLTSYPQQVYYGIISYARQVYYGVLSREELAEREELSNSEMLANLEFFKKLSSENDPLGHFWLGYCYQLGVGVEEDPYKGFALVKRAADADITSAVFNVGSSYEFSVGVKEDINKAIEYYQKASDANHYFANHRLAEMYVYGDEIEQDTTQAIFFYHKAYKLSKPHHDHNCFSSIKHFIHEWNLAELMELKSIAIYLGDAEAEQYTENYINNKLKQASARRSVISKCDLCLDPLEDSEVCLTSCLLRHVFHPECVNDCTTCPLCREKLEERRMNFK